MRSLSLLLSGALVAGCTFDVGGVLGGGDTPAGYQKRKEIIVHPDITEDLSAFPVAVVLSRDPELAAAAPAEGELLFTEGDGLTPLPFEVESYDAGDGDLAAWVRLPFVDATEPTTIYLYYGHPQAPGAADAEETWAEYAGVWHLDEAPSAVRDRTRNANHAAGAPDGQVPNPDEGIVGGGLSFDGFAGDHLRIADDDSLDFDRNASFSVSLWVEARELLDVDDTPLSKGAADVQQPGYSFSLGLEAWEAVVSAGGTLRRASFGAADDFDGWVQLVAVVDRGDNELRAYANGAAAGAVDIQGMLSLANDEDARFGDADRVFHGVLDEVRIYQSVLSAERVRASHDNLARPEDFVTVGAEEVVR